MRRSIPAAVVFFVSLYDPAVCLSGVPPFPLEEFKEFRYFGTYYRGIGSISTATIAKDPDETYRLEMSVMDFERLPPLAWDCWEYHLQRDPPLADICIRPRPLPGRSLTLRESARLVDIFTQVNINYRGGCPGAGYGGPPEWFRWDEFSASSSFCDPPSVAWPESGMIVREMARLKNGSLDCNRNGRLDVFDVEDGLSADVDENGLPDECQAHFQRGDATTDARVDISDPIRVMAALFGGRTWVLCEDAADFDDNGRVDLSDAIATLRFLFDGGAMSAACGIDATEDSLDCRLPTACR